MNIERSAEFDGSVNEAISAVEAACANAVYEFAKWVGKEWRMTEEEWRKDFAGPPPTGTYWDGYNAAIEGVKDAVWLFTGEDRPTTDAPADGER